MLFDPRAEKSVISEIMWTRDDTRSGVEGVKQAICTLDRIIDFVHVFSQTLTLPVETVKDENVTLLELNWKLKFKGSKSKAVIFNRTL